MKERGTSVGKKRRGGLIKKYYAFHFEGESLQRLGTSPLKRNRKKDRKEGRKRFRKNRLFWFTVFVKFLEGKNSWFRGRGKKRWRNEEKKMGK